MCDIKRKLGREPFFCLDDGRAYFPLEECPGLDFVSGLAAWCCNPELMIVVDHDTFMDTLRVREHGIPSIFD